jgi:hypothetical protein
MKAGATMDAQIVVTNNSGAPVQTTGCHDLFQVALSSPTLTPNIAWLQCLGTLTIPTGFSTYPVKVYASALGRAGESIDNSIPKCIDGHAPPLPAGDYQARLYQVHQVVPEPESISVRVSE